MEPSSQIDNVDTKSTKSPSSKTILIVVVLVFVILISILAITSRQTDKKTAGVVEVAPAVVSITAQGFSPASVKVRAGQAVSWTNTDSASHQIASDPHPTHDGLEGLTSDEPTLSGESYSFTFEHSGTYTYHDELHPEINGTIIVE